MEPMGSVDRFHGPFGYQESQAKKFLEAHTGAVQVLRLGETELCMGVSSSQTHQSMWQRGIRTFISCSDQPVLPPLL